MEWINEWHPEGNRIFDSDIEAWEWADSLLNDFIPWDGVGYATPDEKVFQYLVKLVPQWMIHDNDLSSVMHTAIDTVNGRPLYTTWVMHDH